MEAVAGEPLSELRADGGASANGWLMQFQADVLGVPVVAAQIAETTALGAAYLAGVGVGAWTVSDILTRAREQEPGRRYEPRMSAQERTALLAGWSDALVRARGGRSAASDGVSATGLHENESSAGA
jgi:glycerol kinase